MSSFIFRHTLPTGFDCPSMLQILIFPFKALKDIDLENGRFLFCQLASCDGVDDVTLNQGKQEQISVATPTCLFNPLIKQIQNDIHSSFFIILNTTFCHPGCHPRTIIAKSTVFTHFTVCLFSV